MDKDYIKLYTIIPSWLYKTKQITAENKLIAERIVALCSKDGYTWVSNKKLADTYGLKPDTVSKYIKKLENLGLIKCVYGKDSKKEGYRTIYLSDGGLVKHLGTYSINNQGGIGYSSEHNNIYNNKYNNINNKRVLPTPSWLEEEPKSIPASEEEQEMMKNWILEVINDKSGKDGVKDE